MAMAGPSLDARSVRSAAETARFYGRLDGKVYLITGASSGIGLECALSLGRAGAIVCMACRAGAKADGALERVRAAGAPAVHLLPVDLGSLDSVASCAAAFLDLGLPLHGLINNAGICNLPSWGQMSPGVETQFMVNFIGHFQLSRLLHEKLVNTEGSRVVNLASESHRRVPERRFDLSAELPPPEATYDPFHAYAFSNLCRILWTREMAKRVPYPVICLHPSVVVDGTGMAQHMSIGQLLRQVWLMVLWELRPSNQPQSLEQGARTQTWCAVAPVEELADLSGRYLCGNLESRHTGAWKGLLEPTALASRDDLAKKVYDFAEIFVASHAGAAKQL